MKKLYSAPQSYTVSVSVEGMLATSPNFVSHNEVSTGAQLSNNSTWNSSLWAAENDD